MKLNSLEKGWTYLPSDCLTKVDLKKNESFLLNIRQIDSTFGRDQLTVRYLFFYYIVILKCMKDFIFYKILLYIVYVFKCKKANTVIPSNGWTLLKKLIILDFVRNWKPKLA